VKAQSASKTAPTPQREAKIEVTKLFFINAFFYLSPVCFKCWRKNNKAWLPRQRENAIIFAAVAVCAT
jgi:hypothetical protein